MSATPADGGGYATVQLGKLHFKNHSRRDWSRPHPAYGFETITVSDEPGCYDDAYIEWVRAKDPSAVAACRCTSPPAVETARVDVGPREPDAPYVFRGPEHLTHSAFVGEITVDYLRQGAGAEQPFFAVAGFYAPHAPIDPPQSFADRFADTDMPPPAMRPEDRERLGHSDAHWQTVRRYYAALVAHVDAEVGRILDALDATGLADNTLVIFTSDHGEHLGDHGRVGKGAPGYDSCLRVPLLMRWPGEIPEGERVEGPVELADVHAAVLEACGLGDQNPGPGLSCLRGAPGREAAFAEVGNPGGLWRILRSREWKYLVCEDGREELYDLAEDPGELRDLSGDPGHVGRLGTMRLALLRRLAADVPRPVPKTGVY